MKHPSTFLCLIVLAGLFGCVRNANILAIFPFQSKSHFVMLEALLKGLAARGHKVTVVGHFPQKTPIKNYEDLSLAGSVEHVVNNISVEFIIENWRNPLKTLDFIWRKAGVEQCELMYKTPTLQDLIRSKRKFDLVITEMWGSDCFLPVANVFDAPHISMITTMEVPWCLQRYGSPLNPSYHVNHFADYSPRGMTLLERVVNTVFTVYMTIGHYVFSEIPSNRIAKQYLGDSIPHLSEVVKNSSLLFLNSHFSVIGPRPFMPNVVEVGGLHITEPKPLPPDMKKFLDEAKEGAILFSLGSLIRADSLEGRILSAFVEEFRRLPVKVIWKFNGELENQPGNVKTFGWIPQSDILRHPNVKLFITHGGLMGTQEAVTAGVPMLGIPFFADQRFNLKNYEELGFAIKLELEEVNPENVRKAIYALLQKPRYAEMAKYYAELFADRPQTALDTAIYWTEYVIRHKGAKHLRSPAVDLSFIQYHLMDVVLCLSLLFTAVILTVITLIRTCMSGRPTSEKPKRKLKKK